MTVQTLGIDLAKNVFQIHGVDKNGKEVFNKRVTRAQMPNFIAQLPVCLIGMEACGDLATLNRTVRTELF